MVRATTPGVHERHGARETRDIIVAHRQPGAARKRQRVEVRERGSAAIDHGAPVARAPDEAEHVGGVRVSLQDAQQRMGRVFRLALEHEVDGRLGEGVFRPDVRVRTVDRDARGRVELREGDQLLLVVDQRGRRGLGDDEVRREFGDPLGHRVRRAAFRAAVDEQDLDPPALQVGRRVREQERERHVAIRSAGREVRKSAARADAVAAVQFPR